MKHFKWELQGKERLQQQPAAALSARSVPLLARRGTGAHRAQGGGRARGDRAQVPDRASHGALATISARPSRHKGRLIVPTYHPSYALRVIDPASGTKCSGRSSRRWCSRARSPTAPRASGRRSKREFRGPCAAGSHWTATATGRNRASTFPQAGHRGVARHRRSPLAGASLIWPLSRSPRFPSTDVRTRINFIPSERMAAGPARVDRKHSQPDPGDDAAGRDRLRRGFPLRRHEGGRVQRRNGRHPDPAAYLNTSLTRVGRATLTRSSAPGPWRGLPSRLSQAEQKRRKRSGSRRTRSPNQVVPQFSSSVDTELVDSIGDAESAIAIAGSTCLPRACSPGVRNRP